MVHIDRYFELQRCGTVPARSLSRGPYQHSGLGHLCYSSDFYLPCDS